MFSPSAQVRSRPALPHSIKRVFFVTMKDYLRRGSFLFHRPRSLHQLFRLRPRFRMCSRRVRSRYSTRFWRRVSCTATRWLVLRLLRGTTFTNGQCRKDRYHQPLAHFTVVIRIGVGVQLAVRRQTSSRSNCSKRAASHNLRGLDGVPPAADLL